MTNSDDGSQEEDLRIAKNRRRAFKGQLTSVLNQLNSPNAYLNVLGLEKVLERLRTFYCNFDDVLSKIEEMDSDEADKQDRTEFETNYGELEMLVCANLERIRLEEQSQTLVSGSTKTGISTTVVTSTTTPVGPNTMGAASSATNGTITSTPSDEANFDEAFSSTQFAQNNETVRHTTVTVANTSTTSPITCPQPGTLNLVPPIVSAVPMGRVQAPVAPQVTPLTSAALYTVPGASTQPIWCFSSSGAAPTGPIYVSTAAGHYAPQPQQIIVQMPPAQSQISLHELGVRKFDGEDESWLRFRDIYASMVHNSDLSNLRKFLALESCLIDVKAYRHIQGIPISAENYPVAWQRLTDYYENRDRILRKHIKQIYDIPKVQESSLLQFRTTFDRHYYGLVALGQDVSTWDLFLVHHLPRKLDSATRRRYESEAALKTISLKEFLNIVQQQIQVAEALQTYKEPLLTKQKQESKGTRSFAVSDSSKGCHFWSESHSPFKCATFKALSVEKRQQESKRLRWCLNCLPLGHVLKDCTSGTCRKCSKRHHTLLCPNADKTDDRSETSGGGSEKQARGISTTRSSSATARESCHVAEADDEDDQILSCSSIERSAKRRTQVLLATVVLYAHDADGNRHLCRALIDSGSMRHMISERLVQRLRLPRKNSHTPICMLNGTKSKSSFKVTTLIQSRSDPFSARLTFIVMPKVTGDLPLAKMPFDIRELPKGVELADPYFFRPERVDMILGAEHYSQIVIGGHIKLLPELPPFVQTVFGYALIGEVPVEQVENEAETGTSVFVCTDDDLLEQVRQFWRQEEIDIPNKWSIEEKAAEQHFKSKVRRDETGRYSVALPTKESVCQLGKSAGQALRQFYSMERRLQSNPERRLQYNQFMREYLDMGHMEPIEVSPDRFRDTSGVSYTIPHHFVIKETSSTTRLRVVFNASFPTSSGLSLNETLMVGPTIQPELFTALIRFRPRPIGLTGDICKMYRQIKIHENQRDLQRIWWRESPDDPVRCFRLATVTYGTASAPFLATRILQQLAEDERITFPTAAELLNCGFYVDDLATSFETPTEALEMKTQLNLLVQKGGFELRKWHSNQRHLADDPETKETYILGLIWDLESDSIRLPPIELPATGVVTKRTILSQIAKMSYDPLGLFAPTIVCAKLMMQQVFCDSNRGWDDPVSDEMLSEWRQLAEQVPKMSFGAVPRCYKAAGDVQTMEIHAFGDASQVAYGSCIYLKVVYSSEQVSVQLMCAKSRIAPKDRPTIPRLELNAALLTAELTSKVISGLQLAIDKVFLYSDSTITLARINSAPAEYKIYVANRIVQIQELFPPSHWRFVPAEHNPADIVSRGMLPDELRDSKLWWNGPKFLRDNFELNLESGIVSSPDIDEERRKPEVVAAVALSKPKFGLFERYSKFERLVRIFAWMLRFINNCDKKKNSARLDGAELSSLEIPAPSPRSASYRLMLKKTIWRTVFLQATGMFGFGGAD